MSIQKKRCLKCGELKALVLFHHAKKSTDGRSTVCMVCSQAIDKVHRDRLRKEYGSS